MVLMPVGQYHRFEVALLAQIAEVGDHHVDAQHFLFRKHQAAVHRHRSRLARVCRAVFDHHQVETDLT